MTGLIFAISALAFVMLVVASAWRLFEKADQPGWAIFIPFYNLYLYLKIGGKSGWWMPLLFIPGVSLITSLMVNMSIAERFGEDRLYGLGLTLVPYVFLPILAFGDAQYLIDPELEAEPEGYLNEDGEWVEKIPLEDWK